jgi:NADH:ubiquinone oxidoreductase subunit K
LNFGNPTPVFYEIIFVLACTLIAAAMGRKVIPLFFLSVSICYILFIAFVGGFKDTEAFIAGAGFGILIMIPTATGAAIVIAIGYAIHHYRQKLTKSK